MSAIDCIADRFVPIDRHRAIDLASGETVTLSICPAGEAAEQLRRAAACADRDDVLDYGVTGRSSWFEAAGPARRTAGLSRIESAISELFDVGSAGPHVLRVFGPRGAGKTSLLMRLARAARLQGFVPFAVHLLQSPLVEVIADRSVLLLDDERDGRLRPMAELALHTARPHVLLQAAAVDRAGIHAIRLAGREQRSAHVAIITRAAERAPIYGAASSAMSWPVPGEIFALRRQVQEAVAHLEGGRHAPGERRLREAVGALARRGEWASAAEGSLALAASLLRRGRPRDAKAAVDQARESCRNAPGDRLLIAAATLAGVALVDLGRLDEAETVLSAAQTVAAHADDRTSLAPVAVALARCRFWRGQFADARDALRLTLDATLDDAQRVRVEAMRSRIAIADGDIAAAVALAAAATERADATTSPALRAEASCAAAFAHLSAGDLAAVRRDVAACTSAARAARDPLRQLRGDLLLCEALRRSGRREEALKTFARARRLPSSALPKVLRCRRDMLEELLSAEGGAAPDIVSRHVSASGLRTLALFVPANLRTSFQRGTSMDDLLEMLRVCQSAADETTTLTLVCEQLQRQTHAAAVGVFGLESGSLARLAARGPRLDTATAERAIAANIFVAPHHIDERLEAAAPIRYGGQVIGALALRWTIGRATNSDRVLAATTMAATAVAPVVSAALSARRATDQAVFSELLGVSDAMVAVRNAVERAATAPFGVLIEGESGSGKELVARAVHKGGVRRDRPFVTLNCAALPDDLIESELFGHARGAFTGAVAERIGVFEEAHTGTLFLDEIGELSPRAQAKVLRVIQEGELRRVGENTARRVDVRVVAATNRDLRVEAAAGRFRLDLVYRLDVIRICVPPLRERREDIPVLVEHMWKDATTRYGSEATLGPAVISALTHYDWPGNVRELQNVLASLVVRAGRRGVVPQSSLPPMFVDRAAADSCRLAEARRLFDANFVRAALVRCGGRRTQAADELGLTRQGLAKLMARLGISDGLRDVSEPEPL